MFEDNSGASPNGSLKKATELNPQATLSFAVGPVEFKLSPRSLRGDMQHECAIERKSRALGSNEALGLWGFIWCEASVTQRLL